MSKDKNSFVIQVQQHQAFAHKKGQSLLQSMEQQNIDVQYHCREGYCGACRTKLICGEVDYTTDPLAFIDDDEILPCCCEPVSDLELKLTWTLIRNPGLALLQWYQYNHARLRNLLAASEIQNQ